MSISSRISAPLRAVFVVCVLGLGSACTADDSASTSADPPTPSGNDGQTAPPTNDSGDIEFAPGEYRYEYLGVVAAFTWKPEGAELRIDNGGASQLGPPGLYAVTNDQRQVSASVAKAKELAPGASATLDVTFPDDVSAQEAGLVVLMFGDQNWGAFAPVPQGRP